MMKQQLLMTVGAGIFILLVGINSPSLGRSDFTETVSSLGIAKDSPSTTSADRVALAIRSYVATRLMKNPMEINVKKVNPTFSERTFDSSDRLEIEQGPESLIGRSTFLLSVKQKDGVERHHWVNAEVAVIRKVLVATRPIRRKENIDSDAFSLETISQTVLAQQYLENSDAIVGKRASRTIGQAVPITTDMLEDAPIVRRGDLVMLVVETEEMRIAMAGRAKEDGFLGRPLAVVTADGNKTVYGTVMSPSTIVVGF